MIFGASPLAAASQQTIDQNWLNQLPGGKQIRIVGSLRHDGPTATGAAKINGKRIEIAAGSLGTGQVVMWRVKNFRLADIHPALDAFPLNGITVPNALMILAHGPIAKQRVRQLPGELQRFAGKVLEQNDLISLSEGLNMYGRIQPGSLTKDVRQALRLFGIGGGDILLGGGIGNFLEKRPAPKVDLYASLSRITMPRALANILKPSSQTPPTLFLGASAGKGDERAASVRFGMMTGVRLLLGKASIDGTAQIFLTMQNGKTGVSVAIGKDQWKNALGIHKLDLENVQIKIGAAGSGSVHFGLRGALRLGREHHTLALQVAVNPATGLPDPSEFLFFLRTKELSLAQLMQAADIFIGQGKGSLAQMAQRQGLYKGLHMDLLPALTLAGLTQDEDLQLILCGPNASDPTLGVAGSGVIAKARLLIGKTELARADVKVSLAGVSIFGKAQIKQIGPIRISQTGAAAVVDIKAVPGTSPYCKIRGRAELLGASGKAAIELSSRRIHLALDTDLAGFGAMNLAAGTNGASLARATSFTVSGKIRQNLMERGAELTLQGIRAAYPNITKKSLQKIGNRLKQSADFLQLKEIGVKGTVNFRRRDSLELYALATLAGHDQRLAVRVVGLDKRDLTKAVNDLFQEMGSRLFALRVPAFDKDLVRDPADEMYFYEGDKCSQEIVGTVPYDFGKGKATVIRASEVRWFQNDEARSVLLRRLTKGATIVLYDHPDGKIKHGVAVIQILKNKRTGVCLNGFERSRTAKDGSWRVIALPGKSLNGKVSRIKVIPPGSKGKLPPDIIFYEGNNCSQGIKGVYSSDKKRNDQCDDTNRCANDEIRSVRLMGWADDPYTIYVYDKKDWNDRKDDDWAKITVDPRKIATSVCIATFEKDKSTKAVRVTYHEKNGLDGKISRINVKP